MPQLICTLCNSKTFLFNEINQKQYYKCTGCFSVLLHPAFYLSGKEEKERYEKHNNDVEDPKYQKFVSPIVNLIRELFTPEHLGLDFGAGPGPVITKLLRDQDYQINLYDPYFCCNPETLKPQYDYIACCEVIEHFQQPQKEFRLLRSLLKPGGALFCMTEIYSEEIDFSMWHYKNDPTHVFFYHREAFNWIKTNLNYSEVEIAGRLVTFWVSESNANLPKD